MGESDDFEQRLRDEYAEISERRYRLDHFIHSACSSDDEAVRSQLGLLEAQLRIMDAYLIILGERARFAGIQL